MFRKLRLLLALALAPIVLVSTPNVAHAAITYGTPKTITGLKLDHWLPKTDLTCSVTAYNKISATGFQSVKFKGTCKGFTNYPTDYDIAFDGITSEGAACSLYTSSDASVPVDGGGAKMSGEALSFNLFSDERCLVSKVCLAADASNDGFPDTHWDRECKGMTLDLPGDETPVDPGGSGSCDYAAVSRPTVTKPRWDSDSAHGGKYIWFSQMDVTLTGSAPMPADSQWVPYLLLRDMNPGGHSVYGIEENARGAWAYDAPGNGSGYYVTANWDLMGSTLGVSSTATIVSGMSDWNSFSPTPIRTQGGTILGAGVFLRTGASGAGTSLNSDPNGTTIVNDSGRLGINDPGSCSFYWGSKAVDRTDAPGQPAGSLPLIDVGGDPDPEDPPDDPPNTVDPDPAYPDEPTPESGCEFTLSDPSSWASGGMCAVVGILAKAVELLGTLVAKVGELATAIGSGFAALGTKLLDGFASVVDALAGLVADLLGGLVGLFVPDPGVLDDEVAGVQEAWDETTIAKWKDSLTGQSFSFTGSSCSGIPVSLSLPAGLDVNMTFGEACSGTMATAASVLKLIATAFLVIFGGLGCLRALGSGFGWSPGIGKGES